MNGGDSTNPNVEREGSWFRLAFRRYPIADADAALLRRLATLIVIGTIFLAAFHNLYLLYSHKFFDVTGRAQWIWAPADSGAAQRVERENAPSGPVAAVGQRVRSFGGNIREIAAVVPVSKGRFDAALARQTLRDLFRRDTRQAPRSETPVAFFATRDIDLPANRYYTHIKVVGDPEYTFYFNGQEIGGRRVGEDSTLDLYDLTAIARTGRNRIVIAVRSTTATGGIIASVDLSPEVANWIVTDASWKIARSWSPDLLLRDPADTQRPALIGEPPVGRWNYLHPAPRPIQPPPGTVVEPRGASSFITALPEVRDASGTTIVSKRPERATAFDFGEIDGRLRITRLYNIDLPAIVKVRFANIPEELRPIEGIVRSFVFASGEPTVTDTEVRHFRFASIYGRPVKAVVVK